MNDKRLTPARFFEGFDGAGPRRDTTIGEWLDEGPGLSPAEFFGGETREGGVVADPKESQGEDKS